MHGIKAAPDRIKKVFKNTFLQVPFLLNSLAASLWKTVLTALPKIWVGRPNIVLAWAKNPRVVPPKIGPVNRIGAWEETWEIKSVGRANLGKSLYSFIVSFNDEICC